jgi:RNA polymerase sigma-70 factor (ECF subfamily)
MHTQEIEETGIQGGNDNGSISLNENNEAELIAGARQGNEYAFAALFNMHKQRVYTLCLHMSKDTAKAEDLTQDAFMRAFQKLDSFRGDAKFSTWLYRIALNAVLANFRKCKSEMLSVDNDVRVDSSFVRHEVGRGDVRLMGVIDRITLLRAIEDLPAGCRTVFILHDVEGYEHHEIADLLECSIGNSKAQLHKARKKIRNWLVMPVAIDSRKPAAVREASSGKPRREIPTIEILARAA